MRPHLVAGLCLASLVAAPAAAPAQGDRFERREPGLILNSGARMGACDVLLFSPRGDYLMAAGDDKVVPVWQFANGRLNPEAVQTLRWSIFREQKGSMYALAVSPDGNHVAVGGAGVRVGAAAVLNRTTGDVEHGLIDSKGSNFAVWSIAFSPSGRRIAAGKGDGAVTVWNLDDPKKDNRLDGRVLGTHTPPKAGGLNPVHLVAFTGEDQLVSVAHTGELIRWDLRERGDKGRDPALQFDAHHVHRAAISADRKWVAVANEATRDVLVEVRALDGSLPRPVKLPLKANEWPHCLAFDAARERLAVGVRTIPSPAPFHYETNGRVRVFDLRQATPPAVAELPVAYYPEAVAFHPRENYLAVAGGDNHEVTLWDLRKSPPAPVSVIPDAKRPAGTSIWGVAFSKQGHMVGLRDQRNLEPASPNDRGKGPWRVFDLDRRNWVPPQTFQPVAPVATAGGWSVKPSTTNSRLWYVVTPDKREIELPLDPVLDQLPRCYTFLPGAANRPPRLAVGHLWGVSVFELADKQARRTRLLMGHQGEVMTVAPSADGQMLISAGRDQTIAAWSLHEWPSQPDWGARFLLKNNRLFVDEVDDGSPAWDVGLARGDEVLAFVFDGRDMYDPGKEIPEPRRGWFKETYTSAEAVARRLREPAPGKEFYFVVRRTGRAKPIEVLTRVLHRPLWRFFPTRDGEWVLWRWRDYYYDASTNGDSYIGWQVNGDVDETPVFYRAEQFRRKFYRPDKVGEALAALASPEKVRFVDIEPPEVRLRASAAAVEDEDLRLTLSARPRDTAASAVRPGETRDNQKLERVLLWVNDYQARSWAPEADKAAFKADGSFEVKDFVVKASALRQGANLLTVQCYNRAGGRGEAPAVTVTCTRGPRKPKLFGLLVGVGDYSQCEARKKPGKFRIIDLNAHKDAKAMLEMWAEQKDKLFTDGGIDVLLNQDANPRAVLERLRALEKTVRPDDRLVIFLGGHGTSAEEVQRLLKVSNEEKEAKELLAPRSFAMLGPQFDIKRPNTTGVLSGDLYRAITALNCHKLILLDACHSGTIAVNPVRELTRDGVGPVILAACAPHEQAIEYAALDPGVFGLFTMAVRRALTDEFDDADKDGDGRLTTMELVEFVKARVPRLVEQLKEDKIPGVKAGDTQTPSVFLPRLERDLAWVKK